MGDKGSKPKSTSTAKPSQTSAPKPSQTSAPKPRSVPKPKPVAKQTGDKAKDELTWAKANPRLAQAEKIRKEGGSRAEVNKVLYDKGTSAAEKTPTVVKAGVDIFDLVKGYLLDEGYVETEENAIAMMANMSEEWRDSILQELDLNEGRRTSLGALARESQKRKEDKERGREETQDEKDKRLMMGRYAPSQYKYEKDEHGNWKNMGRKDGEED